MSDPCRSVASGSDWPAIAGATYVCAELDRIGEDHPRSADLRARYAPLLRGLPPARQTQFLGGRHCAEEAIRSLSHSAAAFPIIGRDDSGRPSWPDGLTGSITHSPIMAAAIIARSDAIDAIGLDCELLPDFVDAQRLSRVVATPSELARLAMMALPLPAVIGLIFSAKEALFKCLDPLARRIFLFRDAEVTRIDVAKGHFTICLTTTLTGRFRVGTCFPGTYLFDHGHVHTIICLSKSRACSAGARDGY